MPRKERPIQEEKKDSVAVVDGVGAYRIDSS